MVTFPDLEQIDVPNGAQAAATQVMATIRVPIPNGIRIERVSVPLVPAPHKDAALWFKQIHSGYLCARFLNFAQNDLELLHLFASDLTELYAAARWNPETPAGIGGTLRPRRMSIWLQLNTTVAQTTAGAAMLAAMASWATFVTPKGDTMASVSRMNVVVGPHADKLMAKIAMHSVRKVKATPNWGYRLTVRWIDRNECQRAETLQSEKADILSADSALATIQKAIVRLCAEHDAPIHVAMMAPITKRVQSDAFIKLSIATYKAFEAEISKPAIIVLSSAASHPGSAHLQNTGIVVRLAERQLGKRGITNATAFHGALLSFSSFQQEAVQFAQAAVVDSTEGYLAAPVGQEEFAMALHVCATQAEKKDISSLVTLYGPLGRCGEPIRERGFPAWVWVESAAIRPVDADLLKHFCLYPCSKTSIMPKNTAFHEAYRTHFRRASELYVNIEKYKNPLTDIEEPDWLPLEPTVALSGEDLAAQKYILTALRVGVDSDRTTIGEACTCLMENNMSSKVVHMLITAAGKIGVGASLAAAIELCRTAMTACVATPNLRAENASLKRLLEVALEARATELESDESPLKRPCVVYVKSNERVRRMLKALNLKAGGCASLNTHPSSGEISMVVKLMLDLLDVKDAPGAAWLALKHIESTNGDIDARVLDATSKAIDVILRNEVHTTPQEWANIFVLSSTTGESGWVSVSQMANVHPGVGKLLTSSFDELIGAQNPKVLLINFLENGHVRFTATQSGCSVGTANVKTT